MDCAHPDGVFLRHATDEEGYDVVVFRCTECGDTYHEGV